MSFWQVSLVALWVCWCCQYRGCFFIAAIHVIPRNLQCPVNATLNKFVSKPSPTNVSNQLCALMMFWQAYLYRKIFEDYFPTPAAAETVPIGPSIACSTPRAMEWDESFKVR